MKASKYFHPDETTRIHLAVAEAEKTTSAEIVPAIATASGRYDRAEDVAGVWLAAIFVTIAWILLRWQGPETAQWGTTWSRFELPLLLAAMVAGFVLGATLATYIHPLRRIFAPRREMKTEVREAAARVFYDARVHHTKAETGLLIYISVFERTAAIIADAKVLEKLGQETIDALVEKLISGIKEGDAATALCETIKDAGDRLSVVMPGVARDKDELPNALIVID